MYKAGETATFTIEASQGGQPIKEGRVDCVLSRDGWKPQPPRMVTIADGRGTLTATLEEPGFLLVKGTLGKTSALAAAAFDPLELRPSLPVPDDFDQFWDAQKAALAKVPLKSTLTPVESPEKGVEAFDVQVDALGKPVSGYFGRPANAKPKSLPAILFVHGAGVRGSVLGSTRWAARHGGMLALDINAHGFPMDARKSSTPPWRTANSRTIARWGVLIGSSATSRECFCDLSGDRFLTNQPEWDGKTVIVYGSSQGAFRHWRRRVGLPCDAHLRRGSRRLRPTGTVVDRINGWPKIVPLDNMGKPDETVLQASRYFDCVNFAARAKCKSAVVTVGFIDTTCPPTGIYAAYNALKSSKSLHVDVDAGHTNTPAASKFMQDAVERHLREGH